MAFLKMEHTVVMLALSICCVLAAPYSWDIPGEDTMNGDRENVSLTIL